MTLMTWMKKAMCLWWLNQRKLNSHSLVHQVDLFFYFSLVPPVDCQYFGVNAESVKSCHKKLKTITACSTNAWLHTPGSRNYVCGSRTIFCRASKSLSLPSNHGRSWSSSYCLWSHFPRRPIVLITYIWSSKPIYLLCCKKGEIIIESRDIMMKENCQVSANFRDMFMLFRAGPQLLLLFYWICTCWHNIARSEKWHDNTRLECSPYLLGVQSTIK